MNPFLKTSKFNTICFISINITTIESGQLYWILITLELDSYVKHSSKMFSINNGFEYDEYFSSYLKKKKGEFCVEK